MGSVYQSHVLKASTEAAARKEFDELQHSLTVERGTDPYNGTLSNCRLVGTLPTVFADRAAADEHIDEMCSKRDAYLARFRDGDDIKYLVGGLLPLLTPHAALGSPGAACWRAGAPAGSTKEATMAKSYRPMFLVNGEWCGNAVRFATRQEAEDEARDRLTRWTLPTDYRADESDDEPNYRFVGHELVEIEGAPRPAQRVGS